MTSTKIHLLIMPSNSAFARVSVEALVMTG